MGDKNKVAAILRTSIPAGIGAFLFYLLSLPLPFLLGPIAALTIYKAISGRDAAWPSSLRNGALVVLGYSLGTAFEMELMVQMGRHLPAMLAVTVFSILLSGLAAYDLHRRSNMNGQTLMLGSIPGGLSQMLIISEEMKQVNHTVVTLMQTVRVTLVIFIVPWIILWMNDHHVVLFNAANAASGTGALPESVPFLHASRAGVPDILWFAAAALAAVWLARRIRFPAPYLLGPVLAVILLDSLWLPSPDLPAPLFAASQFLLGTYLGKQMMPWEFFNLKKLGLYILISNLLLILASAGMAAVLTFIFPFSFISAFLSTAPGGIAEMGMTAQAVRADISLVMAYHLFRVFFILLIVSPALKWWFQKQRIKSGCGASETPGEKSPS